MLVRKVWERDSCVVVRRVSVRLGGMVPMVGVSWGVGRDFRGGVCTGDVEDDVYRLVFELGCEGVDVAFGTQIAFVAAAAVESLQLRFDGHVEGVDVISLAQ